LAEEKLKRSISKLGFSLLALNGLIGAGIFALPAAATEAGGFFSPWMFLITGLLMGTVIFVFQYCLPLARFPGQLTILVTYCGVYCIWSNSISIWQMAIS
jgi:amino acid permease